MKVKGEGEQWNWRFCALLSGGVRRGTRKLRGGKSLTRFTTSQFASGLDADASPKANRLV